MRDQPIIALCIATPSSQSAFPPASIGQIRTLMHQLLTNGAFRKDTAFFHLHEYRASSGCDMARSDERLWSLALEAFKGHTYPKIRLVVDAIDEALQADRRRILDSISQLLSVVPN